MIRGSGPHAWLGLATVLALSGCLVPQSGEPEPIPGDPAVGVEPATSERDTPSQEPSPEEGRASTAEPASTAAAEAPPTEAPQAESPEPSAQPDLPEDPAPVVLTESVEPTQAGAAPAGAPVEASEPVAPPPPPPPPPEVIEVVQRYYGALSARDWGAAADCFWEGATITRLRAPREGEPTQVFVLPAREVFERFESGSEGPPDGVQGMLDGAPAAHASGNVAQVWCRYVVRFVGPEEVMRWHRFDGVTLVLHEKVWKIAALVQGLSQDRP